jgi:NADPH:quinone reductase-like Zn-dependent oxidoreductase
MLEIVVPEFGGPEQLRPQEVETPVPGRGELRVAVTSIGLNRADLMGRAGQYKLSTGDPPYVPGLEAGGRVDAVGDGVADAWLGRRVTLRPDATRLSRGEDRVAGTYRSHLLGRPDDWLPIDADPETLSDEVLGTLWLSHFTAWGGLVWRLGRSGVGLKHRHVAITAASSAVALAAAQVVRAHGGTTLGLTSSPSKADPLAKHYDQLVITHETDGTQRPFRRDLKAHTNGAGVDVVFDPVAAGPYLTELILSLNTHGTVLVYGLLGTPGIVDVTPLIRKHASITGYVNDEVFAAGHEATEQGIDHVLRGFAKGEYAQRIDRVFPLSEAAEAHRAMADGGHVGKLVLTP